MPDTVLVVEDEPDIATAIKHVLSADGFDVSIAENGRAAIDLARQRTPDLVVLDLMLPEVSGFEVLKALRAAERTRQTPIILLTARKEEIDRLLGFELGADDYVTKPFSPRELTLRVRALLRRTRQHLADADSGILRAGPIEMDLQNHEVRVNGRPVSLTITEFRLLLDLLRARGRVRTRQALLEEVWGYDSEVLSRTVDTHVRRLRSKLGQACDWVETIRGVGYRLQDPERA